MKNIPTFEGKYAITEDGCVWSYPKSNATGGIRHNGRFLKSQNHSCGYKSIVLGRNKQFLIHRLVAETYIPNPKKYPQVNHINGNKSDNRVENLEWCNNSQNLIHSVKIGTYNHTRKPSDNYLKKLTRQDIQEIIYLCSQGLNHQEIADTFNISRVYVGILSRKEKASANNITG